MGRGRSWEAGLSSPHKVIDSPQHPILLATPGHGASQLQMGKLRSGVEGTRSRSHRASALGVSPSGSKARRVIHSFTCSLICSSHWPPCRSSSILLLLGPHLESFFIFLTTLSPHATHLQILLVLPSKYISNFIFSPPPLPLGLSKPRDASTYLLGSLCSLWPPVIPSDSYSQRKLCKKQVSFSPSSQNPPRLRSHSKPQTKAFPKAYKALHDLVPAALLPSAPSILPLFIQAQPH